MSNFQKKNHEVCNEKMYGKKEINRNCTGGNPCIGLTRQRT